MSLKDLPHLAKERNDYYPLRSYPNREKFDYVLKELALEVKNQLIEIIPSEYIIDLTNEFKNKSVFLTGFFKSGTTLLGSLFDFHPEILVLPPESKILFAWEKNSRKPKEEFFDFALEQIISLIYNPLGRFPMNLLNKGDVNRLDIAPYVELLSYFKYFVDHSSKQADLLSAFARALFICNGQFQRGDKPKFWLDKTPTYEKKFFQAKVIFPQAKFIYIVRNPYDNLASVARWYGNSGRNKIANPLMHCYDLKKSWKRFIKLKSSPDICFIRYEDLVSNPTKEMRKLSDFLGIEFNPCLLEPSLLGFKEKPNVSDLNDKNKDLSGKIISSRVENYKKFLQPKTISAVSGYFAKEMKFFGYMAPVGFKKSRSAFLRAWVMKLFSFL